MKYVYILQSTNEPQRHYTGIADDVDVRLKEHNSSKSIYTKKHAPWKIIVSIGFEDSQKAFAFEQYLKSGSGRAFAKKHF
ncbi:MAG: GIY-YIG nuclease family protein [Rickettsiales bacterium]